MRVELGLLMVVSLAACSDSTPPAVIQNPPQAARVVAVSQTHELGRSVYNFRCYFCHGYSGDAKTLASSYLSPQPRNFAATQPEQLSRERMLAVIKDGSPGTAMRGFNGILGDAEMAAVADFIRQEFLHAKAPNTYYHTPANGWPDHQRYRVAFPFATGAIALDTRPEQLTPEQLEGRRLYMGACVSCHDRSKTNEGGAAWESRPLSYPRNGFIPGVGQPVDTVSGASPYQLHDKKPVLANLSAQQAHGETLFQDNCSFCHAADGTGRNWIGSFLEPHPRDLTAPEFMTSMTPRRLAGVIRDGLPDTSMPAWKSVLTEDEIQAVIAYIGRAFHPLAADAPMTVAKGTQPK
jgi:cytochrome c oxidase cbb3-type subunit 3